MRGRISPTSPTTNTVYEIAAKVVLTSIVLLWVGMKSQSPGFASRHDRLQPPWTLPCDQAPLRPPTGTREHTLTTVFSRVL